MLHPCILRLPNMRKLIASAFIVAIALAGCKQKIDESNTTSPPAQSPAKEAKSTADKPAKLPRFASAARIAEIKASGRTGFWIDTPEYCPGHQVAVLTWNVEASGAKKVTVYVVDKNGKEQHFGRGGPIGERQTGPWMRPDITFKLRNQDGGAELGSITVPRGKSC
jgi:hypothetical protein